jgi:hypothetical protein
MKTVEFKGTVTPNGQLTIPAEVVKQLPPGEQLQVVLVWDASAEDSAWRAAGRRQFEAAYAPEDSVYEQLIDDTSVR